MGVLPNYPFLEGIFPYKPSIVGYPYGYGNAHICIYGQMVILEQVEYGIFSKTYINNVGIWLNMLPSVYFRTQDFIHMNKYIYRYIRMIPP